MIHKSRLTNIIIFGAVFWNPVVNLVILKEMKRLEGVEYKIPQILIHVYHENPAIKAVDGSPPVHHLGMCLNM